MASALRCEEEDGRGRILDRATSPLPSTSLDSLRHDVFFEFLQSEQMEGQVEEVLRV